MGEERNRQEERETDARGMEQRRRNGELGMGRKIGDGKEEWGWEGGMVMGRRNGDRKKEW